MLHSLVVVMYLVFAGGQTLQFPVLNEANSDLLHTVLHDAHFVDTEIKNTVTFFSLSNHILQ